jgi:hypothetical protein
MQGIPNITVLGTFLKMSRHFPKVHLTSSWWQLVGTTTPVMLWTDCTLTNDHIIASITVQYTSRLIYELSVCAIVRTTDASTWFHPAVSVVGLKGWPKRYCFKNVQDLADTDLFSIRCTCYVQNAIIDHLNIHVINIHVCVLGSYTFDSSTWRLGVKISGPYRCRDWPSSTDIPSAIGFSLARHVDWLEAKR